MIRENNVLIQAARTSLLGKWGLAIVTFLLYGVLISATGSAKPLGPILSLLISGPLLLGVAMFSLNIVRKQVARIEDLFSGFIHFGKALGTYLLMVLLICLWSLLLIVPGIIAALSYAMTFFILADEPSLTPAGALRKSALLMMGHKWKLFYLSLRFLLLALLCVLTLGIGFLWLIPFVHVTMAQFYEDVREQR